MNTLVIVCAAGFLSTLSPAASLSQQPAERPAAAAQSHASLEQRIADLEAQITRLARMVAELRAEMAKDGRQARSSSRTEAVPSQVQTRIVHVQYADAESLAQQLRTVFGSEPRLVVADPRTNSIILTGDIDQMRKFFALMQELDQPAVRKQ